MISVKYIMIPLHDLRRTVGVVTPTVRTALEQVEVAVVNFRHP